MLRCGLSTFHMKAGSRGQLRSPQQFELTIITQRLAPGDLLHEESLNLFRTCRQVGRVLNNLFYALALLRLPGRGLLFCHLGLALGLTPQRLTEVYIVSPAVIAVSGIAHD